MHINIKNPLKRLAFHFIRNEVEEMLFEYRNELRANAMEAARLKRSEIASEMINLLVGKPVICFGNQNTNPIIGFCTGKTAITADHVPVPVIANYVNLETSICLGKVFIFTKQRYEAMMLLSGEQRCSLFGIDALYNFYDLNVKFDEPSEKILTAEELNQRLEENNFWNLLNTYREDELQKLMAAKQTNTGDRVEYAI